MLNRPVILLLRYQELCEMQRVARDCARRRQEEQRQSLQVAGWAFIGCILLVIAAVLAQRL